MRMGLKIAGVFATVLLTAAGAGEEERSERISLFEDTGFRRGFLLAYPSSARGRAVEKVLVGADLTPGERAKGDDGGRAGAPEAAGSRPVWRLCQWATRVSLAAAEPVRLPGGAVSYEDETKRVVYGGGAAGRPEDEKQAAQGPEAAHPAAEKPPAEEATANARAARGPDLVLELRAGAEYRGRARAAGEPWPHLLVEQDAARVIALDRPERLELEVDVRLSAFADRMDGRADPGLHAAQLQIFFIVRDVSPGSSGSSGSSGDYLWFGVPFFDSRAEYPAPHRGRDGGKDDATGRLIVTMDGREVLPTPLGRGGQGLAQGQGLGKWVSVRKDILPAIREALAYAVEEKFLASADPARYAVVNMNLGWEMPGAFDATAEIRGLAVTALLPRHD